MKKAVHIVAIIEAVLIPMSLISLAIIAITFTVFANNQNLLTQLYDELAKSQVIDPSRVTLNTISTALTIMATFFWLFAVLCTIGLVFDILILRGSAENAEPEARGKMIAFGIFAIIFGAEVAGVLQIIYGAMKGKKE